MLRINKLYLAFAVVLIFASVSGAAPSDSVQYSFGRMNKNKKFISFYFGMGANYSNNTTLKSFVEYSLPNYSYIPESDKISSFGSGLEFAGGLEYQIAKRISLKADYSYYMKSVNAKSFPYQDFSYTNHQPYLILNYIFPQEFSYIKFGIGAGYIISNFTVKNYGSELSYKSDGFGIKGECTFNAQIGKNFAVYLNGYVNNTFMQNLKDDKDVELLNVKNEKVDLSSLGFGLRLGAQFYFFN